MRVTPKHEHSCALLAEQSACQPKGTVSSS